MLPTTIQSPSAEALVLYAFILGRRTIILRRCLDTSPLGYSVSKDALSEQNSPLPYVTVSPSLFYGRVSWLKTKVANQQWVDSEAQDRLLTTH